MKYIVVAICTIFVCGLIFSACERSLNIIESAVETDLDEDFLSDDGLPANITGNIDVGNARDPDIKPYNPEPESDD